MHKTLKISIAFILLIAVFACQNTAKKATVEEPNGIAVQPEWAADAVIYEVNIRQYTPEGTFNAFAKHLPRLKELGVEILWIMPVHPISEKNRKGSLGSYYAVADYKGINPEFGTMEDFKNLVTKSHEMGFKIIIDWVANHTGWDNPWIFDHPEWFTKDSTGAIIPPNADWSDIADLNFDVPQMRRAMIDAMDFWLTDADIDGFRCDVAWGVEQSFWEEARASLDSIKPVFMLAEDEDHLGFLDKAFHSNYAWHLHHLMNSVAKGEKSATDLKTYFEESKDKYAKGSFPMQFITNHDENSWQGTVGERMGDAADAFAVFSFTVPGMPLIYSGQEAGLDKRLLFFEKDEIDWSNLEKQKLYEKLVDLKVENKALWNGNINNFNILETSENTFAFTREMGSNKVLVVLNLSSEETDVTINDQQGKYTNVVTEGLEEFGKAQNLNLTAWGYNIYIQG